MAHILEQQLNRRSSLDGPRIFGFMHVAMHGHWKAVVAEQLAKLAASGLYERTERIFVALLGPDPAQFTWHSHKIQIVHRSPNFEEYEFPVLKFLHKFSQDNDSLVFYLHTKGVFNHTIYTQDWRHFMEYFVISRYQDCIDALQTHQLCGVNWKNHPFPHYSGNFWWSKTSYVRDLCDPISMPELPSFRKRYNCEFWIGSGHGKIACLKDSGVSHYTKRMPPESYIDSSKPMPSRIGITALEQGDWSPSEFAPIANRPIIGFMHVAMNRHWREIVTDQFIKLRASGLWDRSERIFVGLLGSPKEAFDFDDPKLTIAFANPDVRQAEIPTLAFLQEYCHRHSCIVYYMHCKGVFRVGAGQEEWRRAMEHFLIHRHDRCLKTLESNDTCGINFLRNGWSQIYGGNFWWARSEYVRTLPPIESLETLPVLESNRRFVAERWIGENSRMRAGNLHYTKVDHYGSEPYPRSRYAGLREVHVNGHMVPSAWTGLENRFQDLLEPLGTIRQVVEIGVDTGFSAFSMALAMPEATITGIDPLERSAPRHVAGNNSPADWVGRHHCQFPNFVLIRMDRVAAAKFVGSPIDVLHLNRCQTYEEVGEIFAAWEPRLRVGGCILFHETISRPESVGRFFRELPGRKVEIMAGGGLGAWYKPDELGSKPEHAQ